MMFASELPSVRDGDDEDEADELDENGTRLLRGRAEEEALADAVTGVVFDGWEEDDAEELDDDEVESRMNIRLRNSADGEVALTPGKTLASFPRTVSQSSQSQFSSFHLD